MANTDLTFGGNDSSLLPPPDPSSLYRPVTPGRTTQPMPPTTIGQIPPPGRGTQPLPPVTLGGPTTPTRTTQPTGQTTLPGLPSQYALSLLKQGKTPQQVVDETNTAYNLQPGSQAVYYNNNNTIGLADGYYLAGPTFQNNMADWSPVARGNESAGASGQPDLTGLLTSLLSRFSAAQPTNAIAAMPAPVAPSVAPQASSGMPTNPYTGQPMFSQNPITGALSTNTGAPVAPLPLQPLATGPSMTTQSMGVINPGGNDTQVNNPTVGLQPGDPGYSGGTGNLPLNPSPMPASGPADPGAVVSAEGWTAPPATGATPTPGSGSASASGNPFTDPTQMALWEAVQAAISQSQQVPGQNPQTAALFDAINKIATQLQGPAFTDQQLNNIRTASMDSIQRDQDNAIQAEIQRQGLLGQSPTSGTVTDAISKIKSSYDTLRGQAQQANNVYELNTIDQRRQELLQALNLGATTATGNTQLGFNNAVTGAQLSTLPVSAENTALQNALGVTNASNPSLLLSSILSLINSNNSQGNINASNNSQLAIQLGNLLAGFL